MNLRQYPIYFYVFISTYYKYIYNITSMYIYASMSS